MRDLRVDCGGWLVASLCGPDGCSTEVYPLRRRPDAGGQYAAWALVGHGGRALVEILGARTLMSRTCRTGGCEHLSYERNPIEMPIGRSEPRWRGYAMRVDFRGEACDQAGAALVPPRTHSNRRGYRYSARCPPWHMPPDH